MGEGLGSYTEVVGSLSKSLGEDMGETIRPESLQRMGALGDNNAYLRSCSGKTVFYAYVMD